MLEDFQKIVQKEKEKIIYYTDNYDGSKEMFDKLSEAYTNWHINILNARKLFEVNLYENLKLSKNIYIVDNEVETYDLDYNIIDNIVPNKEYYTLEEADMLLKWTINNARNIMSLDVKTPIEDLDLLGFCGFSQFITLYPLQKLGLDITINNAAIFGKTRHAFGSVSIPVLIDDEIVKMDYLIDATYSQFFKLERNHIGLFYMTIPVINDSYNTPDAGYFMVENGLSSFAENLIKKGYCVLNNLSAKNYAYGFYMLNKNPEKIAENKEKFQEFEALRFIKVKQEDFDYDEEEINNFGYSVDITEKNLLI